RRRKAKPPQAPSRPKCGTLSIYFLNASYRTLRVDQLHGIECNRSVMNNQSNLKHLTSVIFSLLGIASAGFGIKAFLQPTGFIDGGVPGVSMLLAQVFGLPLSLLLLLLNLPFLFFGFRYVGHQFAIRTVASMIGLSLFVLLVDTPAATHDKLLTAVF